MIPGKMDRRPPRLVQIPAAPPAHHKTPIRVCCRSLCVHCQAVRATSQSVNKKKKKNFEKPIGGESTYRPALMLSESVHDAPSSDNAAVKELLTVTSALQPSSASLEHDQKNDGIRLEGAAHNVMREALTKSAAKAPALQGCYSKNLCAACGETHSAERSRSSGVSRGTVESKSEAPGVLFGVFLPLPVRSVSAPECVKIARGASFRRILTTWG